MIWWHKLYHFTVANTRFTAPLTRRGKTKFATIKWYNLCQQIIQPQTCYPLSKCLIDEEWIRQLKRLWSKVVSLLFIWIVKYTSWIIFYLRAIYFFRDIHKDDRFANIICYMNLKYKIRYKNRSLSNIKCHRLVQELRNLHVANKRWFTVLLGKDSLPILQVFTLRPVNFNISDIIVCPLFTGCPPRVGFKPEEYRP